MATVRIWPAERIVRPDDGAKPEILVVRDYRTGRPVDPYDGLEVDASDVHFARLIGDGDLVTDDPRRSRPAPAVEKPAPATEEVAVETDIVVTGKVKASPAS